MNALRFACSCGSPESAALIARKTSRVWPSPAISAREDASAGRGAPYAPHVGNRRISLCEPVIDRCQEISLGDEMCKCTASNAPCCTAVKKKHDHSSDDRL